MKIFMEEYVSLSNWQLIELIRAGETLKYFDILKERHKGIIYKITGKYFRTENIGHALKISAIEEGEAALLRAAVDYNPQLGVDFKKYAWLVIEGYIQNYILQNRSLISTSAMQKRSNKLLKVISKPLFSEDEGRSLFDIINNDYERIKNVLIMEYPEENWDKFLDETIEILNSSEISIDRASEDEEGNEINLHEKIKSGVLTPLAHIENREAISIFRETYNRWMHEIISGIAFSQKNKEILEMYYIGGINENILIDSMNGDNLKGYANFRKIKSRFKKKVCGDHIHLLEEMFAELNEDFDFNYIGSENALCEDFIDFCESIRHLGLLEG